MSIKLRYSDPATGEPLSAVETVRAVGAVGTPHSWLTGREIAICRQFAGDEAQARVLLDQLEKDATWRYETWRMYQ